MKRITGQLQYLFGASIVKLIPTDTEYIDDYYTTEGFIDINELSGVVVKCRDGKLITFTAHGYDEDRHIEWEETIEDEEEK